MADKHSRDDYLCLRDPALSDGTTWSYSNLLAQDIVLTVILGSSVSRALRGNAPLVPPLVATLLWFSMSGDRHRTAFANRHPSRERAHHNFVHERKVDWQTVRSAHFGENHITESLRL